MSSELILFCAIFRLGYDDLSETMQDKVTDSLDEISGTKSG